MLEPATLSLPPRRWWASRQLFALATRHRQLAVAMARREVSDRYAGHVLGTLWSVAHPLVLMAVYVFIFGVVFRVAMGASSDEPFNYTVYILSGLIPWLAVADALNRAPTAVTGNANLVKQVVFPIEVLPAKTVLASLLPQVVQMAILVSYVLIVYRHLPATYLLLPLLVAVQTIGLIGASYLLASLSVYLRDIKDIVQVFTVVGAYLMPMFYLPSMVPELFRPLLYANPLSYMIWCYQDTFYYGRFEHPWAWLVFVGGSAVVFYAGARVFGTLKPHFGSAL
jgi:lipopolysaccharide transport system permease protein